MGSPRLGYFRALFTRACARAQAVVDVGELGRFAARDVIEFLYPEGSTRASDARGRACARPPRLDVRPLLELGAAFLADGLAPETTLASWAVASAMGDRVGSPARARRVRARGRAPASCAARPRSASSRRAARRAARARRPQREGGRERERARAPLSDAISRRAFPLPLPPIRFLSGAQEEDVFDALQRWLAAPRDPPLDDAARLRLLELVRYPLMAPAHLSSTVDPRCAPRASAVAAARGAPPPRAARRRPARDAARRRRDHAFLPFGVRRSFPDDFLSRHWRVHIEREYSLATTVEEIESVPPEATHVFVGARDPDGRIALGACGRRDEVLRRTVGDETHKENGACWYFSFNHDDPRSFGFSRVAAVELYEADILGSGRMSALDEDGHFRLSWHADGGGWRAGQIVDDGGHELDGWTKLLYWATF